MSRISDESQARAVIEQARGQFPDARHHCSAYLYTVADAVPVRRFSDDGEPAGTAGKPILDILTGSGLLDICAVVIRYFGGIKLGAGGLVHAYSQAAAQTMELIDPVLRVRRDCVHVELDHGQAGRIEAELRARPVLGSQLAAEVVEVSYGAQVQLTVALTPGAQPEFESWLAGQTSGQAHPVPAGQLWRDIPAPGAAAKI